VKTGIFHDDDLLATQALAMLCSDVCNRVRRQQP
jgi:hypothetical protein